MGKLKHTKLGEAKKPRTNSKYEDIYSKSTINKITKYEGFIDYKIIHKIHCKIQANTSTIQSELGGGNHGLIRMKMQPATYQTVIEHSI